MCQPVTHNYGEHNVMAKLQIVGDKSAAGVLGYETVNALEMHVVKTIIIFKVILKKNWTTITLRKQTKKQRNKKQYHPTNIKTNHLKIKNGKSRS